MCSCGDEGSGKWLMVKQVQQAEIIRADDFGTLLAFDH
jgi:predicted kinase